MQASLSRALTRLRSSSYSRLLTGQTDEAEFLPAALEITETPPRPAGRIIAGSLMLFFAIALLWACIGSVDIIATAPGKIMPTGRTKVIQPLESGVVHAIHVQDGQKVKAGDVLIEIDTTVSAAERDRLKNDYMQAMLDTARLKAALELDADSAAKFVSPEGATDTQITLQKTVSFRQACVVAGNRLQEPRCRLPGRRAFALTCPQVCWAACL
jgi:hemolysin D